MMIKKIGKEAAAVRLRSCLIPGEIGVLIATRAHWGDQDLCSGQSVATAILSEEADHYQGRLLTDRSRVNVLIPKSHTRKLLEFEVRILEKRA